MSVPHTRRGEDASDYHGTTVADPYRWLEQLDTDEVAEWVAAQNSHTQSVLAEIRQRGAIGDEFARYSTIERRSPPLVRVGTRFEIRNDGTQEQDDLWVVDDRGERLLIAAPSATTSFTSMEPSPDGRLLAYSVSEGGSDWSQLRIRDVHTGTDLDDRLDWVKFPGTAWFPDGRAFLYSGFDPAPMGQQHIRASGRPQVRVHRLGTPQEEDEVVFDGAGLSFAIPHVSADGRHIVVELLPGTVPTGLVVRAADDGGPFLPVVQGPDPVRYVGMRDGVLYVQSHAGAPNGEVVAIDVVTSSRRVVVPERSAPLSAAFGGAYFFGGHIITAYRAAQRCHVVVTSLDGQDYAIEIPLPNVIGQMLTGHPDEDTFYFGLTSLVTPTSVAAHRIGTREITTHFTPELGIDASRYVIDSVEVTSADGTSVPMLFLRRDDAEPDGDRPTMLLGYGGFGINFSFTGFLPWVIPWLEHGGVIGTMGLRGGGEYGEVWHAAGMREHKQNVFDDAIACAEWCVEQSWTRPERLAVLGSSNGGLLAAAVLTQRPDLWGTVVISVGVLDLLRYHLFTGGAAWVPEYGSSEDPASFAYLVRYSPLHNVRDGHRYPATIITTGVNDTRVSPGVHSFKFAASLQAAQAGDAAVLLRVQTAGGHGRGAALVDQLAERTDVFSFVADALGWDWTRSDRAPSGLEATGVPA